MENVRELVKRGIAAYNAGDKATAQRLFQQATQLDNTSQAAWLWLGASSDDRTTKRQCAEKVYQLDPETNYGQQAAKALQSMNVPIPPPARANTNATITLADPDVPPASNSNQRACRRCQRTIGLLERFTYNQVTGRCGTCEKEIKSGLVYVREAFLKFTSDHVLSDEEQIALEKFCHTQRIPYDEAISSLRPDAIAMLERALTFAHANGEITEAEETNFFKAQQTLRIADAQIQRLLHQLAHLKHITAIRHGHLPTIKPSIHLDAGEIAHLETSAIYHRVTRTSVIPVAGRMIATSKQLHFVAPDGGWPILLKNILRVVQHGPTIQLELSVKRGAGKYTTPDPLLTEAMIDALVRIEKRQMLMPQSERASRRIPHDVRKAVWNRDQGKCAECGAREYLEFDHVIPFSKGGDNSVGNIQLLCRRCNQKKGDRI
ncbi:MAG: hypothetical protein HC911_11675 [Chloroflexaceae bacterium]|nr:hypothetical protein [Chloroflexaceae bacterium]